MNESLPLDNIPGDQTIFAWNGIAFRIPKYWDMASNQLVKGVSRIVLEDDTGPRLEIDWTRPNSKQETETFRKRTIAFIKVINDAASASEEIKDIPRQWTAHLYKMENGTTLVTAYVVPEKPGEPFAFFRIHFPKNRREIPTICFQNIARSFQAFHDKPAPWNFLDVNFTLDNRFKLASTSLLAGQKLLAFEWRLRRLFIWHFSMADYITRNNTPAKWCADFLNRSKLLPAPKWMPKDDTSLTWKRKKLFCLGQFEEIGRLCYKYKASINVQHDKNLIRLVVFNYRKNSDLDIIDNLLTKQDNQNDLLQL